MIKMLDESVLRLGQSALIVFSQDVFSKLFFFAT